MLKEIISKLKYLIRVIERLQLEVLGQTSKNKVLRLLLEVVRLTNPKSLKGRCVQLEVLDQSCQNKVPKS